jgi:hypothetical protein
MTVLPYLFLFKDYCHVKSFRCLWISRSRHLYVSSDIHNREHTQSTSFSISHYLPRSHYFPLLPPSPVRAGKCVSKQIGKGVFVAGAIAAVVGSVALAAVPVTIATEDKENREEDQK